MLINLASVVVIVAGIMAAKSIVIPFLLAAFLSMICAPPLYWLRVKGVPNLVSIMLLVLIVIFLETLLAGLVSSSMGEFSRQLPTYQHRLNIITRELIFWGSEHGIELTEAIIQDQFDPGKLMRMAANMLNNLFGVLTNTFMIMVTFIFILLEATGFPDKIRAMTDDYDIYLREYGKIIRGVNRYLGLKVITSLATGSIIYLGLTIIGVDFALMWAVVAFLLNFVPTIGSIIASVPPVLLALVQLSPAYALATAGLYLVTNITIGNFVEPRVMGSGVGLSALVIFISLVFWGWVLGPVGMLLSVPLTMTLKIALSNSDDTHHLALLLGSNNEAARVVSAKKQLTEESADNEKN